MSENNTEIVIDWENFFRYLVLLDQQWVVFLWAAVWESQNNNSLASAVVLLFFCCSVVAPASHVETEKTTRPQSLFLIVITECVYFFVCCSLCKEKLIRFVHISLFYSCCCSVRESPVSEIIIMTLMMVMIIWSVTNRWAVCHRRQHRQTPSDWHWKTALFLP